MQCGAQKVPKLHSKSIDGGQNWQEKFFSNSSYETEAIGFVNDTVGWIIDNHNETFDHLLNLSKTPTPAFQTWSAETPKRTDSDHAVSSELFRTIPGINQEIIRDLIKVVQFDEEIDDEKRKKVLATAYLMIGEADKALELLNDK